MKRCRGFILLALSLLSFLGPVASASGESFLRTYERTTDSPRIIFENFIVSEPSDEFVLVVDNGAGDRTRRAAGAVVKINGVTVVSPIDFKTQMSYIKKRVPIGFINVIEVEIRGKPGSVITVAIHPDDDTLPDLWFLTPTAGAVEVPRPAINVAFSDNGSGVDLDSFRLAVNGVDVTADAAIGAASAFYWPEIPLPVGDNVATARIADLAGNVQTAAIRFTVSVFRAIADCSPTSGSAPLQVRFRSRGEFTGGSIERYRWDFEGDGTYDRSSVLADDYTHTFTTGGTYQAVLEVTNNFDETATDRCTIQVGGSAPSAMADAAPSNGPVPLDVNFTCTGTDADGAIVLYEWDFDGDGIFDHDDSASGAVTHTYTQEGSFVATCRVTDDDGLTAAARTTTTVIRAAPPGSPSVTATASPNDGEAPLTVFFGGSAIDDGTIALWEWDFDGNGVYDYSSESSPATSFTYADAGIFAATLRATDDEGKTGTDTVEVIAEIAVSLTIPDDTFEPGFGESATIVTSLSAAAQARILLKDRDGVVVRTLVDETRAAGNYRDFWDGTDDSGNRLPEGPYYAILEYEVGDEVRRVDLTDTTGGSFCEPPRGKPPSTFNPFEDDLLPIRFTVPTSCGALEIQAFIGLFHERASTSRIVTLLNRVPLGAGTYTIHWDGLDANGNIAVPPPGDSFLAGLLGFTLPANTVFLKAAPVISEVAVDPNFFDPATPDFLSPDEPLAVVRYALDRPARVELTVTNLKTGLTVHRITQPDVEADTQNAIAWDGHTDAGHFADAGDYRLSLQAIDAAGSRSIMRYALVRVFY